MAIQCTGIPAEQIDQVWPLASAILEPAIAIAEKLDGVREDVYAKLKAGAKQLYVAQDEKQNLMCLVTEIDNRPDGKVCYLAYLAGRNLKAFMRLQPKFEEWARSLGCVAMESLSPKGLMRVMRGWREIGREGNLIRLRLDLMKGENG